MKKILALIVALAMVASLAVVNVSAADYYVEYVFEDIFGTEGLATSGAGTTVTSPDGSVLLSDNSDRLNINGGNEFFGWTGTNFGLGNTWVGDYVLIKDVAFGSVGASEVMLQCSNLAGEPDKDYGIYIDNTNPENKIATVTVSGMLSWDWPQEITAPVTKTVTGTHDLYIKWETGGTSCWGIHFVKGAASEAPVESEEETPVEPEEETPVESEVETPVESEEETPVEPEVEVPVESEEEVEVPSEEEVETPSEEDTTTVGTTDETTEEEPGFPIVPVVIGAVVVVAVVVIIILKKKK